MMKNIEGSADSTGQDMFLETLGRIEAKAWDLMKAAMEAIPELHEVQESQQEEREKEQELLQQVQINLQTEQEAGMRRTPMPLPFQPEELEEKLLEQITSVGKQQANVQSTIKTLRSFPDLTEEMASMAIPPVQFPGGHQQKRKDILEYFQREVQPDLAQRMIALSQTYLDQKVRNDRARSTHGNVPAR